MYLNLHVYLVTLLEVKISRFDQSILLFFRLQPRIEGRPNEVSWRYQVQYHPKVGGIAVYEYFNECAQLQARLHLPCDKVEGVAASLLKA